MTDKGLLSKLFKQFIELNSNNDNNNNNNKKQFKKMAKYLYRHFSKDIEMANRHLKRHSLLPIIREMEIKTTIRFHFRAVRIATSIKYTNNKCWIGCGGKETPLHYLLGCKLVQLLWKTVWRFLRKLKIELTYDPAILLLYLEKNM